MLNCWNRSMHTQCWLEKITFKRFVLSGSFCIFCYVAVDYIIILLRGCSHLLILPERSRFSLYVFFSSMTSMYNVLFTLRFGFRDDYSIRFASDGQCTIVRMSPSFTKQPSFSQLNFIMNSELYKRNVVTTIRRTNLTSVNGVYRIETISSATLTIRGEEFNINELKHIGRRIYLSELCYVLYSKVVHLMIVDEAFIVFFLLYRSILVHITFTYHSFYSSARTHRKLAIYNNNLRLLLSVLCFFVAH